MDNLDEFTLLPQAKKKSEAIYIDVNPSPNPGQADLLTDTAAVFASIRNLFRCPRGARGKIYQEDYFCALYELLQEPFDDITASKLSIALYQAFKKWEPRIEWSPSDLKVFADATLPGYQITVTITVSKQTVTQSFSVPLRQ